MTYAPTMLRQVQGYLRQRTGLPYVSLGIVGNDDHDDGYHLGKDRITKADDYSARHPRDKAGLTDAASALDIGGFELPDGRTEVDLCSWMVVEAKAGRRSDTREIIAPVILDGVRRAFRWAAENDWKPEPRPRGDSHERHVHESFYRDSEHRDKLRFYAPFFERTPAMALRDDYDGKALIDRVASMFAMTEQAAYGASGQPETNQLAARLKAIHEELIALRALVLVMPEQVASAIVKAARAVTDAR